MDEEDADSKDQESGIVGTHNHLLERGFVPPLVLQLPLQQVLLFGNYTGALDLPQPAEYIYEDLRKAVGDDPMPFTFDELMIWARPLVMAVNHRIKTPETMKVLQNEWKANPASPPQINSSVCESVRL